MKPTLMNIKKHIPNLLTLGNLLCGTLATIAAVNSDYLSNGGNRYGPRLRRAVCVDLDSCWVNEFWFAGSGSKLRSLRVVNRGNCCDRLCLAAFVAVKDDSAATCITTGFTTAGIERQSGVVDSASGPNGDDLFHRSRPAATDLYCWWLDRHEYSGVFFRLGTGT